MKARTKLFWKFFFEQKLDEVWNFIKNVPSMLLVIPVAFLFMSVIAGIIYLIGLVVWLMLHAFSALPPRLNVINADNVLALGMTTAIALALISFIIVTVYHWIKSNVDKARFRVELELNREKDNESKG